MMVFVVVVLMIFTVFCRTSSWLFPDQPSTAKELCRSSQTPANVSWVDFNDGDDEGFNDHHKNQQACPGLLIGGVSV